MRFLVLAHVDGDQLALAAVQDVGQRQRGLGLADAGRADEEEDAAGLVRVFQLGGGGAHALGNRGQRMVLADDALAEQAVEVAHGADLVLTMRPSGTPVQAETISATTPPSTCSGTIGVSPAARPARRAARPAGRAAAKPPRWPASPRRVPACGGRGFVRRRRRFQLRAQGDDALGQFALAHQPRLVVGQHLACAFLRLQ